MIETSNKPLVEDTEENRAICAKLCKNCQNYRKHQLDKYQPDVLFCARGQSSCANMKMIGCYCTACELYTKYHQRGGFYCVRR